MKPPKKYIAKITKKEQITPKVVLMELTCMDPRAIEFIPGQFVNLEVAPGVSRAYSICSDYKEVGKIELIIANGHEGVGSNFATNAKVGDEVKFIGPSGRFWMKHPYPERITFFATGTGIAPFIPMLIRLQDIEFEGPINLYFGARHANELMFINFLDQLSEDMPNFHYQVYLSGEDENVDAASANKGHITKAAKALSDDEATGHFYLCGHPAMLDDVTEQLVYKVVPQEDIVTEGFTFKS